MSRHRGAKHRRRYELLGGISLLSPEYLYPLSDGPSIQNHRITKTCFRTCSTRRLAVKHPYAFALGMMSDQLSPPSRSPLLFGRRPPQSNCPPDTVPARITGPRLEPLKMTRVVFQGWLHQNWRPGFQSLPPILQSQVRVQCQAIVKVHGVFPSCRGYTASSQRFQFH